MGKIFGGKSKQKTEINFPIKTATERAIDRANLRLLDLQIDEQSRLFRRQREFEQGAEDLFRENQRLLARAVDETRFDRVRPDTGLRDEFRRALESQERAIRAAAEPTEEQTQAIRARSDFLRRRGVADLRREFDASIQDIETDLNRRGLRLGDFNTRDLTFEAAARRNEATSELLQNINAAELASLSDAAFANAQLGVGAATQRAGLLQQQEAAEQGLDLARQQASLQNRLGLAGAFSRAAFLPQELGVAVQTALPFQGASLAQGFAQQRLAQPQTTTTQRSSPSLFDTITGIGNLFSGLGTGSAGFASAFGDD